MPGGQIYGVLIVKSAAVGDTLSCVVGIESEQVGHLNTLLVDDCQALPFLHPESHTTTRWYFDNLRRSHYRQLALRH